MFSSKQPVRHKITRLVRDNLETLFAVANFGASSVFWLVLAFMMPARLYGTMMTVQAAVFLIVTAFTLRTHDLVFFLVSKHDASVERAFRTGLAIEITAALLATLACTGGAAIGYIPAGTGPEVAALALLAGIGSAQGAVVAKLRYLVEGRRIMVADATCMAAWLAAGTTLLFVRDTPVLTMLIIGATPNAIRTVALVVAAHRHQDPDQQPFALSWGRRAAIGNFLSGAQLTNFLKNGSVSIETMILATFCSPAAVAMYRLAKSTQGVANAAINVEYQRSYSALARATTHSDKRGLLHHLQRVSTLLCLALYPVSAAFALGYALHKPDIDVWSFQLITLAAFIAFIPAALQQGYMILLMQEGAHQTVNRAYIVSVGLLCLLSLGLYALPSIWVFLAALILSAVARVCFLSVKAAPLLS